MMSLSPLDYPQLPTVRLRIGTPYITPHIQALHDRITAWVTIRELIFATLAIRYFDPSRGDNRCIAYWSGDYLEKRMELIDGVKAPVKVRMEASQTFEAIVNELTLQFQANQNADQTLIYYANTHFLRDVNILPTYMECILSDLPF